MEFSAVSSLLFLFALVQLMPLWALYIVIAFLLAVTSVVLFRCFSPLKISDVFLQLWLFTRDAVISILGGLSRLYDFMLPQRGITAVLHSMRSLVMVLQRGITILFHSMRSLIMVPWTVVTFLFRFFSSLDKTTKLSVAAALYALTLGLGALMVHHFWRAVLVLVLSLVLLIEFLASFWVRMSTANTDFRFFGIYFRQPLHGEYIRFIKAIDMIQLMMHILNLATAIRHAVEKIDDHPSSVLKSKSSLSELPTSVTSCFITFLASLCVALSSQRFTRLQADGSRVPMTRVEDQPYDVDTEILLRDSDAA